MFKTQDRGLFCFLFGLLLIIVVFLTKFSNWDALILNFLKHVERREMVKSTYDPQRLLGRWVNSFVPLCLTSSIENLPAETPISRQQNLTSRQEAVHIPRHHTSV